MQQVQRIVALIDLFRDLPEEELSFLVSRAAGKRYEPGETLFFEGEDCRGIWILTEGLVKIVKSTPSGRQVVLAMPPSPSTIAEVPVFDGAPYPATVTAVEPTRALLVLRDDFLAVCRRNPDLTLRFLAVFSARLRHLVSLVERITFGSIRQRLAHELLTFAEAAGSDTFVLPETHEELAGRLGTVREVVSRNLGRFQTEGILRIQRREVQVLDRAGLRAEAETEL